MFEFSFRPNTNNSDRTKFFSLLLFDLFVSCSFIISHPLHSSHLSFIFSPYIVNIFSFLFPLFLLTIFLLRLALFTAHVNQDNSNSPQSSELKASVMSNKGEQEKEAPSMESRSKAIASKLVSEVRESAADKDNNSGSKAIARKLVVEVRDNAADNDHNGESKAIARKFVREVRDSTADNDHIGVMDYLSKVRSKCRGLGSDYDDNGGEYSTSEPLRSSDNRHANYSRRDRGFGTMRKETEWKKTLACKLLEERHNVNLNEGAKGIELLWETNGADLNKVVAKSKTKKGKKDGSAVYNPVGKKNLRRESPKLVRIPKALFRLVNRVTKHVTKIKVCPFKS